MSGPGTSGSTLLKCFKTWLSRSDQSYTDFITAVTVVHRTSSPYVLTRWIYIDVLMYEVRVRGQGTSMTHQDMVTRSDHNCILDMYVGLESWDHWRRQSVRGLTMMLRVVSRRHQRMED